MPPGVVVRLGALVPPGLVARRGALVAPGTRGPLLALAVVVGTCHLVSQARRVAVLRRRISSPGRRRPARRRLDDPGVFVAGSVVGVAIGWLLGGPAMAVLVLVGVAPARIAVRRHERTTARRAIDDELPALLEALAAAARSGATLPVALREAAVRTRGGLREPLVRMVSSVDGGVPLAVALEELAVGQSSARVRSVVGALSLALRLGGAEARALDGLAASLRDRQAVDRELRALSAQARASAAVMVVAPLVFVGLSATGDPEALAFFTRSAAGGACLLAGVALDAAGAAWMWSVVRSVR